MNRKGILNNIISQTTHMELLLKEREDLESQIKKYTDFNEQLEYGMMCIEADILLTDNGIQSYKESRLKELSMSVEDVLDRVFTGEDFIVQIKPTIYNGKKVSKLRLGKGGVFASMKMQNGRMCRQSVSFTINTQLQIKRYALPILIDEALNSGDIESTKIIGTSIGELSEKGYQMLLTEHKSQLYDNLKRRQFNLKKDKDLDRIVEIEVTDYDNI